MIKLTWKLNGAVKGGKTFADLQPLDGVKHLVLASTQNERMKANAHELEGSSYNVFDLPDMRANGWTLEVTVEGDFSVQVRGWVNQVDVLSLSKDSQFTIVGAGCDLLRVRAQDRYSERINYNPDHKVVVF